MTETRFFQYLLKNDRMDDVTEALFALKNAMETVEFMNKYSDEKTDVSEMEAIEEQSGKTIVDAYRAYEAITSDPESLEDGIHGVCDYKRKEGTA